MRFKKNWGFIWQEKIILGTIAAIGVGGIIIFLIHGLFYAALVFAFCICAFLVLGIKTIIIPGHLTDEIVIDSEGISLEQKNADSKTIAWNEIIKIIRTRNHGTNALAVLANDGSLIWFYTNSEIEKTIMTCYPKAENLFEKNTQFSLLGK